MRLAGECRRPEGAQEGLGRRLVRRREDSCWIGWSWSRLEMQFKELLGGRDVSIT